MRELLNANGMSYRHYPGLGGRPADPTLYIDGDKAKGVDNEKLIGSMPFVESLNRIRSGLKTMKELHKPINIAFVCMEQRKEDCHRWNAVAKALKKLHYKVEEIEYPSTLVPSKATQAAPTKPNYEQHIGAQREYCRDHHLPMFVPSDGLCFRCNKQIYEGMTIAEAGNKHITGCPHCLRTYCD